MAGVLSFGVKPPFLLVFYHSEISSVNRKRTIFKERVKKRPFLFTSKAKKVQIFFTDFFGIGKTYNVPGSKNDCWTLRLTPDYENFYYENLQINKKELFIFFTIPFIMLV